VYFYHLFAIASSPACSCLFLQVDASGLPSGPVFPCYLDKVPPLECQGTFFAVRFWILRSTFSLPLFPSPSPWKTVFENRHNFFFFFPFLFCSFLFCCDSSSDPLHADLPVFSVGPLWPVLEFSSCVASPTPLWSRSRSSPWLPTADLVRRGFLFSFSLHPMFFSLSSPPFAERSVDSSFALSYDGESTSPQSIFFIPRPPL